MFSNHSKDRGSTMQVTTYGVDLAKRVFQVHWVEAQTGQVKRKTLLRQEVSGFFAQREAGVVAIEACGSAHHWGRLLTRLGHQVRLVSAQLVRPFVKTNKTDAADAQAIWEAAQRPEMRFVVLKSVASHMPAAGQVAHHAGRTLEPWTQALLLRRPKNVAIVALANKMARTAWALLADGRTFDRNWSEALSDSSSVIN
jgi:transposase